MKKYRTLIVTSVTILVPSGAILALLYYYNVAKFYDAASKPSIRKAEQLPEKVITPSQKTEFAKQISAPQITGKDIFEKSVAPADAAPYIIAEDVANDPLIAEKMRQKSEKLHMAYLPPKPVYELIEEEIKAINSPAREETDRLDRIAREGKIPEDTNERSAE